MTDDSTFCKYSLFLHDQSISAKKIISAEKNNSSGYPHARVARLMKLVPGVQKVPFDVPFMHRYFYF
jgi:hypothetical protein